MDPQPTPPAPSQPITPAPAEKKKISKKTLLIIGIVIGVLLLGAGAIYAFMGNETKEPASQETAQTQPAMSDIPYLILYGAWSGDNSVIFANDLTSGKEYQIASLPEDIKKVTLVAPNQLLYIADTNRQDHGQSIKITDLTTGETTTIYSALDEYGIDDYEISPNGQYLATWEVKFLPGANSLIGGSSRVVTINRSNLTSNSTIYEEVVGSPVNYPVGVTNEGNVFTDKFLPNTGEQGFGYGVSVSNLDGTVKSDIPGLTNGTIGTQPNLSPNGRFLAMAGYDGSRGPGTANGTGYRQALLTPNTVVLLDTTTNETATITSLPNTDIYPLVRWNNDNTLLVNIASQQNERSGTYQVNIDSQSLTPNPQVNDENMITVEAASDFWVAGLYDPASSSLGNLGKNYSQPFESLTLTDAQGKSTTIDTSVPLMQFIDVLPSTQITKSVLKNEVGQAPTQGDTASIQGDKLQLGSFTIKEELAPTREAQQSDPPVPTATPTPTLPPGSTPPKKIPNMNPGSGIVNPNPKPDQDLPFCGNMADAQKLAACGPEPTPPLDAVTKANYGKCVQAVVKAMADQGICYDSPLYLYGPEGLDVTVNIKTPTSDENLSAKSPYSLTLGKKGIFYHKNKSYSELSFNYRPAIFVKPPKYGVVIPVEELEQKAKDYAKSLGLNTRETNDLVQDLKSKARGEYIFLSFFDQETSKYLLPISFDPTPDTYINYVFYIKNLNSPSDIGYTPKEPTFPRPEPRGEFTAVEISLIAE